MAYTADLIGLGFPPAHADILGFNPNAAVTAAGTTTTDATVTKPGQEIIIMTATGSDGIRFPSTCPIGGEYIVVNTSASTGKVYPHTGGNLNGGTTDAALSLLTHTAAIYIRISSLIWVSVQSA